MFSPRYSIRTILLVTAGFAVFFLFVGSGIRGHAWAGGVAVGIGSLTIVAVVHAAFFWLCWVVAGRSPRPNVAAPDGHQTLLQANHSDPGLEQGGVPDLPTEGETP